MSSAKFPAVSVMMVICRLSTSFFDVDPDNVLTTANFTMTNIADYAAKIRDPNAIVDDLQQTMNIYEFNALIRSTGIPFVLEASNREGEPCHVFRFVRMKTPEDQACTKQLLLRFLKEITVYNPRKYAEEFGIIFNCITVLYESIYGNVTDGGTIANRDIWNLLFMKRDIPYFIDLIKTVDQNQFVRNAYDVKEVHWNGQE